MLLRLFAHRPRRANRDCHTAERVDDLSALVVAQGRQIEHLKKIDVENNGVSPDNGKTRLNPTYAHTQGVSGAAGSRFLFFSKCSV